MLHVRKLGLSRETRGAETAGGRAGREAVAPALKHLQRLQAGLADSEVTEVMLGTDEEAAAAAGE